VAGVAASAAAACGGSSGSPTGPSGVPGLPTLTGSVSGNSVTVAIDPAGPLGTLGGVALVQSSRGAFLVSRTTADGYTALTATCTHQACTITGFTGGRYVCPCHGSNFDTSGHVLQGPAPSNLRTFPAAFANGTLTIAL
jgi:Rieske Fe-S protein